jgi:hypothetical protein
VKADDAAASDRPAPAAAALGLTLLAIAAGVTAALGLLQLLHRANDPLLRAGRLLDLCYEKISAIEATLAQRSSPSANQ